MKISWLGTRFSIVPNHENIMVRHTKFHDTDHENYMVWKIVFMLKLIYSSYNSETPSPDHGNCHGMDHENIMCWYMIAPWFELWRFHGLAQDNFMGHTMSTKCTGNDIFMVWTMVLSWLYYDTVIVCFMKISWSVPWVFQGCTMIFHDT